MKKIENRMLASATIVLILVVAVIVTAVYITADEKEEKKNIILVVEEETIGNGSYNELVLNGLKSGSSGANISYIAGNDSMKSKLDKAASRDADIIWTIPSITGKDVIDSAKVNPDITYVMVDFKSEAVLDNLLTISFNSNESSFLGGCAAAMITESNIVGFVGGQKSEVIEAFEYGYKSGVKYTGKILGKDIEIVSEYANTFSDENKGKTLAYDLYEKGCDVIFQAAGVTGTGVIEESKIYDRWAIGTDVDQEYLAPDNVLTSVIKEVTKAAATVSEQLLNGEDLAGLNVVFNFSNGAEGIVQGNLSDKQYNEIMEIKKMINSEEIIVPDNESDYEKFLQGLV